MKSLISIIFLLQISMLSSQTREDLFNKNSNYEFTFYGIDYSNAKFIGEFAHFENSGIKNMEGIKSEFFYRWNELIVKERNKFDVEKAFKLNNLNYRIDLIEDVNQSTNPDSMAATNAKVLSKPDIQKIVSKYNFSVKEGVGIVFIAEFLDKNKAKGCFHFVVFNNTTKEVLLQSRFIENARGFGLRNYWANPIYQALKGFDKRYKGWKKGSLD